MGTQRRERNSGCGMVTRCLAKPIPGAPRALSVLLIGARPGRVLGDVPIDLLRPRRRGTGDAGAVRLVQTIAAEIRAEVEKVAREEADGAWGSSNSRDGSDARRHLGGGI